MRRMALTGIAMMIGGLAGLFLVSAGHFLGMLMGVVTGLVIALMIQAFPREADYPRDRDDIFG
jgi:hypothetical protein